VLADLAAGRGAADPQALGDPTLLPPTMERAAPQDVASVFGTAFATHLDEAPVGQWSGPVQSSFGLHVVRVDERTPGVTPTLDSIRPIVDREWRAEQRERSNAALLAQLRAKYEIRFEARVGAAAGQGQAP
jgi:parvulin-like peptidyl-prolyl isomerase